MSDNDTDHDTERRRSFVCVLRGIVRTSDPAHAVSEFLALLAGEADQEIGEAIVMDRDLGDPGRLDGQAPLRPASVGCLVEIASWDLEEGYADDAVDLFRHLVRSNGLKDVAAVYVLPPDDAPLRFDPETKALACITRSDDRWWDTTAD